jgi:hypothetical protein
LEDGKKQREDGGRRRRWGGGLGFDGFVSVGIKRRGKQLGGGWGWREWEHSHISHELDEEEAKKRM